MTHRWDPTLYDQPYLILPYLTHRWDPTLYDQPYLILPYLTHRLDPTLYDQPYLILPYLTHRWDPTLYDQPYLILPYLTHRWDTNRLPERDVHHQTIFVGRYVNIGLEGRIYTRRNPTFLFFKLCIFFLIIKYI